MRSPSGRAVSMTRGVAPVATSTTSVSSSCTPSAVSARTVVAEVSTAPAGEHADTDLGEAGGDVVALGGGQVEHPGVDLAQVGHGIRDLVALGVLEVHAELVGGLEVAHVVGGGDQRLAGHAVGEHRGPAEPVALDHGDLGAEVRGDEGGLVATRPPTEDDDSARPRAHDAHPTTARRWPAPTSGTPPVRAPTGATGR